jgi:hypothetical protein
VILTEIILAMLGGASLMAACFGCYILLVRAATFAKELRQAFAILKTLGETAKAIVLELQLLRTYMEATAQPQTYAVDEEEQQIRRQQAINRRPFPTPYRDMYEPVPDARPEDTEISETTDEGAATREKLEEIRQTGIEADPAELDEQ